MTFPEFKKYALAYWSLAKPQEYLEIARAETYWELLMAVRAKAMCRAILADPAGKSALRMDYSATGSHHAAELELEYWEAEISFRLDVLNKSK